MVNLRSKFSQSQSSTLNPSALEDGNTMGNAREIRFVISGTPIQSYKFIRRLRAILPTIT
jgi:hypothetical protein